MVRLPDLRLRARAVRRDRGHHALDLHAGVPGPPAALRLVHREPAGALAPASVRVRPAQPHPHRPVEARAPAPRQRGPRARLGRPADADALGPAPPRLPRRGDPRLRDRWSAWPGPTASSRSRCSSTPCATCSTATRSAASRVLDPLKVVIENYPEGQVEEMEVPNNPEDPSAGTRKVPFTRELWIERDDFMEEPPKKFFRLAPGREVRLRSAYFVTCSEVVKDADGRDRRAAVHVRPGHARRRRSRRPPPQGDPALGVGRHTPCPPRSASTTTSSASPYPGADGRDLFEDLNPDSETVLHGLLRRAVARRRARRARPCSSSGSATSARTRTRRPARSCSTGRSRSRTPGRSCRRRGGKTRPEPTADHAVCPGSLGLGSAARPLLRYTVLSGVGWTAARRLVRA